MSNETSTEYDDLLTGQVKWFNVKAGYGFVTVCDGEHKDKDIFVHFSALKVVNSQYRYLVQGEYVNFNIVKPEGDKYEYHASNVTGIKGGTIMCETRHVVSDGQPRRTNVRKYRPSNQPHEDSLETIIHDPPGFEKVVRKKELRTPSKKPVREGGRPIVQSK